MRRSIYANFPSAHRGQANAPCAFSKCFVAEPSASRYRPGRESRSLVCRWFREVSRICADHSGKSPAKSGDFFENNRDVFCKTYASFLNSSPGMLRFFIVLNVVGGKLSSRKWIKIDSFSPVLSGLFFPVNFFEEPFHVLILLLRP